MDAIEYLTDQHREIESLFDQVDTAARPTTRRRLRRKLVDLIAVHRVVEERIFYPAASDAGARELVLTALVEHLSTERAVEELVEQGFGAEAPARMRVLRAATRRHADAEERELFPSARELLPAAQLEALGRRMAILADCLMAPGVGVRERVTAPVALA